MTTTALSIEKQIPWRSPRPYIVHELEPGRAPEQPQKPWLDPQQMALAKRVVFNEHQRQLQNGVDLTGMRFGRLLVLRFLGMTHAKSPKRVYECLCDCGVKKPIRGSNLTSSSKTRSCSCLRVTTARENGRMRLGRKFDTVRRRRA